MPPPNVEVLLIRADVPIDALESLQKLLDDADLRRAYEYRRPEDRRRYIVAHAALRSRLAPVVGDTPQALRFSIGPHGKPAGPPAGRCFSISHSGDYVALAFSSAPVGVDVQEHRAIDDRIRLAATCFSPPELSRLKDADGAESVFFAVWTAKEAVVKGDGRGIAAGLQTFAVPAPTALPSGVVDLGAEPPLSAWRVARFDVAPGYSGAVAAIGDGWIPEVRRASVAEILAGL